MQPFLMFLLEMSTVELCHQMAVNMVAAIGDPYGYALRRSQGGNVLAVGILVGPCVLLLGI